MKARTLRRSDTTIIKAERDIYYLYWARLQRSDISCFVFSNCGHISTIHKNSNNHWLYRLFTDFPVFPLLSIKSIKGEQIEDFIITTKPKLHLVLSEKEAKIFQQALNKLTLQSPSQSGDYVHALSREFKSLLRANEKTFSDPHLFNKRLQDIEEWFDEISQPSAKYSCLC